jgi:ribosomal protein S18 acetylase RimI-like enzyme
VRDPAAASRWIIQRLGAGHDRDAFDCGVESLNTFLQRYAGQNERHGICQTYVAVLPDAARVQGYYALSAGSIAFDQVPEPLRKRLPKYPIPVAHLGRLAVDRQAQGQGLGELLLLDAFERIVRAAEAIGIHAVEVRAIDEPARGFYLKYGFVELCDDPLHLYLALATLRKLGLV